MADPAPWAFQAMADQDQEHPGIPANPRYRLAARIAVRIIVNGSAEMHEIDRVLGPEVEGIA